jgi:type IV pilus assembly protein PilQ
VEVVIENAGSAPQLEQTNQGGAWLGRLITSRPAVLLRGPQAVVLPEAGVRSLSIEGSGTVFTLRATPVGGYPLRPPLVSADGRNLILSFAAPMQASLQTTQRNSLAPGAVANPNLVPPLRARATAPPVGDMAVGTMVLKDPSYLNVRGPRVTLTFRGVPVSVALQSLARLGKYGFVYNKAEETEAAKKATVTASFVNEDFARAFNLVLAGNGIQAKMVGNTIVAGPNALRLSAGNLMSKVYRLNQASSKSAAEYLASLGALIRVPNTTTTTAAQGSTTSTGGGSASGGQTASSTTSETSTFTVIQTYGGTGGPLIGLSGTTDGRLGTITLVGTPNLVAVAEQYLRQIDLRQRQVALSVRILDVTLDNDRSVDNSFAFRYGNNFIVNKQGELVANFGELKPPSTPDAGLPGLFDGATGSPIVGAGAFRMPGGNSTNFLTPAFFPSVPSGGGGENDASGASNLLREQGRDFTKPGSSTPFYNSTYPFRPGFGAYNNPGQPGVTEFTPGTAPSVIRDPETGERLIVPGTAATYKNASPTAFQYPRNQFFDYVRAVITSSSTKVLASPTLVLSENAEELVKGGSSAGSAPLQNFLGTTTTNSFVPKIGRFNANESAVVVGEQVTVNFNVQAGQNGAPNSCEPVLGIAGLTFGARVSKIDDNGFVTFSLSPTISAAVGTQLVAGCGGQRTILNIRSLDTGSARVRDGQTLILTGVLSDRDVELVAKWPVLGDIPIVGQFFRNSSTSREKRELVVMVTPRIINDTEGGSYGYGFQPSSRDSKNFMNSFSLICNTWPLYPALIDL